MIVIDSSSVLAILFEEPEAESMLEAMFRTECVVAAPTLFEMKMVAGGRTGPQIIADIDELIVKTGTECRAWDESHVALALDAFRRYGKGRHPAKLNFGDCISYALAKSLDAPLLFKGDDFARTDIASAL